jgi:exonuclease III
MRLNIFSYNVMGVPWFPDQWTEPLGIWIKDCIYDFVCLQEVFTLGRVNMVTKALEGEGYKIYRPNDFASSNILNSGLITAIKTSHWTLINDGFTKFNESIGAENLANKGFHWLLLKHKSGLDFLLINTHMQADHPLHYFAGCTDTRPTRRKQVIQILDFLKDKKELKHLIVGDLNAEKEAHEDLIYLTGSKNNIQKHTFWPTGEDLDHIAFVPNIYNGSIPTVLRVSVLERLWWSDHWPIDVCVSV